MKWIARSRELPPWVGAVLVAGVMAVVMLVFLGDALVDHSSCADLHQFQADGFRMGQLAVSIDGSEVALVDTPTVDDEIHISWGPVPALMYAAIDIVSEPITGAASPKLLLYAFMLLLQVVALFFVTIEVLPGRVLVSAVVCLGYLVMAPILNALLMVSFEAGVVAAVYAATFFTLALWFYLRHAKKPTLRAAVLAATFLLLACLTRQVYFLSGFFLTGWILLRRGLKRDAIAFSAIALTAVFLHLGYNQARFSDPTDFGSLRATHAYWEEMVYNRVLGGEVGAEATVPASFDRRVARFQARLEGWFGYELELVEPDATVLFTQDADDVGLFLLDGMQALLVGLLFGVVLWFRRWREHLVTLTLVFALLPVVWFHLFHFQGTSIHYALDVWPWLFLLCVRGTLDLSRWAERWSGRSWVGYAFHAALGVTLVAALVGDRGDPLRYFFSGHPMMDIIREPPLSAERFDANDPTGGFCQLGPDEEGEIIFGQRVRAVPWVRCQGADADPGLRPDNRELQPPRSLHRTGIYRQGEACYMLFYAGAVLQRTPGAACRLELELERQDVSGCDDILLYIEGEQAGRLDEMPGGPSDRVRCGQALPEVDHAQTRVAVFFSETELRGLQGALSEVSQHYQMHEMGIVCEP